MSEVDLFDKIEDYLKGRLSAEAKQAFESEMTANPAIAKEVSLHRDLFEAIPVEKDDDDDLEELEKKPSTPDVAALRKLMENAYQSTQEKQNKPLAFGLSTPRILALLTLLLLAIASIWWLQRDPKPTIPETAPAQRDTIQVQKIRDSIQNNVAKEEVLDTLKPSLPNTSKNYAAMVRDVYDASPYAPSILMSDEPDEPNTTNLIKASEAYSKKQFGETVKLLQSIPDEGRTDALKLRSHAYFRLKRYDLAALDFGTLSQSPGYQYDADWYLLLSYAARLPKTKAQYNTQLAKVTKPGHPFERQAIALNKRIGG
jgi:hypothetical protein